MDLQNLFFTCGIMLLVVMFSNGQKTLDKAPFIGVRLPVTVPVYVGQQPISRGSAVYPYYYYYPQSIYPNTGVVYQPSLTGVQYPYYGWTNTPTYNPGIPTVPATPTAPTIPTAPTNTGGGSAGVPHDPKKDVEFIY